MKTTRRHSGLGLIAVLGLLMSSPAQASFTFTMSQSIHHGPVDSDFIKNSLYLTNTGVSPSVFNLTRSNVQVPAGWTTTICKNGACVAPESDTYPSFTVPAGDTDTIAVYFTSNYVQLMPPYDRIYIEGSGYATLTVDEGGVTPLAHNLGAVTDGCDVLVVDDDEGGSVQSFFESAITNTGRIVGTWRRRPEPSGPDSIGRLDSGVSSFPVVVWCTGTSTNTLNADDRQKLGDYLAAGGGLLLSGQDIAFDLCDPASPNYSVASRTWFEDWMNSTYVSNASGNLTLNPVAADPVAQGLALAISGGNGANNQTDPDVVAPATWATNSWLYGGGGGAGAVRTSPGGYRAIHFGFGFEAISSDANRNTVMGRAVTWLEQRFTGIPGPTPGSMAGLLRLEPPRPNPLRGSGALSFWIAQPGHVTVEIVDLKGRTVNRLADERLEGGAHVRQWNGRDLHGSRLGSGVYFVVLRSNSLVASRKLVLAN